MGEICRRVVLLCGPPGSGKTTAAWDYHLDGLEVFDLDDDRWSVDAGSGSGDDFWGRDTKRFEEALRKVGNDPCARAVVIRSGATRAARLEAARLVRPTELEILRVPAKVCKQRVLERRRARPPLDQQLAAVHSWWKNFQRDDGSWRNPDAVPLAPRKSGVRSGYGKQHRELRRVWDQRVRAGGVACHRCGLPIGPSEPWDLGHDDHDRSVYAGPEHRKCNRSTAGRRAVRKSSREW